MRLKIEHFHNFFLVFGFVTAFGLLLSVAVMVAYQLAYEKVILPKTYIGEIEVSNLSVEEAEKRMVIAYENEPNLVQLTYRGQVIADTLSLSKEYDFGWAADLAYSLGRSGNPLTKIKERIKMFFQAKSVDLPIKVDQDELAGIIGRVAVKINQEGVEAKIAVTNEGEVKIEPGIDGLLVNEEVLKEQILAALVIPGTTEVEIATEVRSTAIDNTRMNEALEIASRWKGQKMRLYREDFSYELPTEEIFKIIGLSNSPINENEIDSLLEEIRPQVEVEAKNAVFNFDEGKVIEFSPEVDGVKIDDEKFKKQIAEVVLSASTKDLLIPVNLTEPKIKAGDINSLGIKELIGVGTSLFRGSIANRIHNLTLASKKLNGIIVAPGETFSFNQALGDISKATGYREAYVISAGRTVLGDGGGVCQTSTTMFRAVLNAGLPVVERKAHAYRVHYYEDDLGPGYDATVYNPSADLKFINDTPGHILIQTKVDLKALSLRYEIYGTSDGRKAEVSPANIYARSPALATVYQDDPTLPKGEKKQVDWSAPGAKVSFDYKVTRNGEVLQDRTFYSSYQPWAAVYLVGTGELASR